MKGTGEIIIFLNRTLYFDIEKTMAITLEMDYTERGSTETWSYFFVDMGLILGYCFVKWKHFLKW